MIKRNFDLGMLERKGGLCRGIDEGMKDLVITLNTLPFVDTSYCCEGHNSTNKGYIDLYVDGTTKYKEKNGIVNLRKFLYPESKKLTKIIHLICKKLNKQSPMFHHELVKKGGIIRHTGNIYDVVETLPCFQLSQYPRLTIIEYKINKALQDSRDNGKEYEHPFNRNQKQLDEHDKRIQKERRLCWEVFSDEIKKSFLSYEKEFIKNSLKYEQLKSRF